MIVYRLSKDRYSDDLSGHGAELSGGRWNSKGIRILCTSDSRALCTAEIAVHVPMGIIPSGYKLISIEIPDLIEIFTVNMEMLPENWRDFPYQYETQSIGDDFIRKGEFAVMKVPSAVVPGDFNYLVNPGHRTSSRIKVKTIEDFSFDKRLFRAG